MAAHDCGGCRGEGNHRRWCPEAVGRSAALFGSLSQQVETIGDTIGANEPGFANRAYALAGDLRALALTRKQEYLDRIGRIEEMRAVTEETRRLANLEGLGD